MREIEGLEDATDLDNWIEHVDFLLQFLIKQAEYLNYLNKQFLTLRMNQEKIIKFLRGNNANWQFLLKNLKPLSEEHKGMVSYLSILTRRVTEIETSRKHSKKSKSKYD